MFLCKSAIKLRKHFIAVSRWIISRRYWKDFQQFSTKAWAVDIPQRLSRAETVSRCNPQIRASTPLCNHNLIKPTKFFIGARIGYVACEQLHEMILLSSDVSETWFSDNIVTIFRGKIPLLCEGVKTNISLSALMGPECSPRELVLGTMLNREPSRGEDEAAKLTNSELRRLLSYLLLESTPCSILKRTDDLILLIILRSRTTSIWQNYDSPKTRSKLQWRNRHPPRPIS